MIGSEIPEKFREHEALQQLVTRLLICQLQESE